MNFEWNSQKAESNLRKYGISSKEAKTVFNDPLYLDFYDPDHSGDKYRYLIVGRSYQERLLIVAYTERDETIRIISARQITQWEREFYENGRF